MGTFISFALAIVALGLYISNLDLKQKINWYEEQLKEKDREF